MKSHRMVSTPAAVPGLEPTPRAGFLQRFQARNRRIQDWFRARPHISLGFWLAYLAHAGFEDHTTAAASAENREPADVFTGLSVLPLALCVVPVLIPFWVGIGVSRGLSWILFGLSWILFGKD